MDKMTKKAAIGAAGLIMLVVGAAIIGAETSWKVVLGLVLLEWASSLARQLKG